MSDLSDEIQKTKKYLDKMEKAVKKLKYKKITKQNSEKIKEVLVKYIKFEDYLMETLQSLPEDQTDLKILKDLAQCIDKFNELGSDFQDNWEEDMWSLYNEIRKKKLRETNSTLNSTLTLSPAKRRNTLQELDEISRKYIESITKSQNKDIYTNSCCKCLVT